MANSRTTEVEEPDLGDPKPPIWLLFLYGTYAVWAVGYLCLYWLGD